MGDCPPNGDEAEAYCTIACRELLPSFGAILITEIGPKISAVPVPSTSAYNGCLSVEQRSKGLSHEEEDK